MKKGWQIIIAVVSIIVLLGGICMGVGFITGADTGRIFTVLDNRYDITLYMDWFREDVLGDYIPRLVEAWKSGAPESAAPAVTPVPTVTPSAIA